MLFKAVLFLNELLRLQLPQWALRIGPREPERSGELFLQTPPTTATTQTKLTPPGRGASAGESLQSAEWMDGSMDGSLLPSIHPPTQPSVRPSPPRLVLPHLALKSPLAAAIIHFRLSASAPLTLTGRSSLPTNSGREPPGGRWVASGAGRR